MLRWFLRTRARRWTLLIGAVTAFVASVDAIDCAGCYSTWRDSGMAVDWGVMSGCRVKSGGHWIPASAFRKVP